MKQSLVRLIIYQFLLVLCLSSTSCGDGCNENPGYTELESTFIRIYFQESDTLNVVDKIYYPQIDKTILYRNWSESGIKYLYGYDENIVVLVYKYPEWRQNDTLVLNSPIVGIEEAACRNEYIVKYGKVVLKKHPFQSVTTDEKSILVVKR